MSDSLRESISALVDDEAQELELRRVLSSMETDDELRKTWKRYQVASFAMKRQMDGRFDLDISGRVAEAIDKEPAIKVSKPRFGFFKPVLSMAVAASAAFLVIFAVQFGTPDETGQQLAAGEQPLTTSLLAGSEPLIGAENLVTVSTEARTPVEKRLQTLIESHTQQASMSENRGVMPYTQLVESQEGQRY
ncbi:MAG: sigma-E factor negative regulatory protein [Pseudomonadales bacterium]|jgi:sigma-E factor negative regulatory protein RseA